MNLEKLTTLVVGRNNSGKTSLYELLRRFLSDRGRGFKIEDFSTACHCKFVEAAMAYVADEGLDVVRMKLPSITLELRFKYDPQSPDFGALAPLIVDLEPDTDTALAVLEYGLIDGRVHDFFEEIPANLSESDNVDAYFRVLRDRIPEHYGIKIRAEDPNDPSNTKVLQFSDISALLDTGFVNAQRGLDHEEHGETDVLGRVLEKLFLAAREPNADPKDRALADSLEEAIGGVQEELDKNVQGQLNDLLPSLKIFGFPALNDSELLTETTLDVVRLLSNFTRVRYAGHSGIALPESYNGLGVRNLILILMRIVSYFKRFRASDEPPGMQIIFIEEPEAHLHPQMQEVFIRQLNQLVKDLTDEVGDGFEWPVQFVVSTHSSHVANEASFECIRYFLCRQSDTENAVRQSVIKDLRTGLEGTGEAVRVFLHKYLTLTRCDLFFADKAILIEGMSERLMVPVMIDKLTEGGADDEKKPSASSQYISLLEVGGAYAHYFINLLNFLELRSLIITDVDSVAQEDGAGQFKACRVNVGKRTSNSALRAWFGEDPCEISSLSSKDGNSKVKSNIRIAYQVPDHPSNACGRTFEDAFILANPEKFELVQTSLEGLEDEANEVATKQKKSTFALLNAIDDTSWTTPLYIKEGLLWLSGEGEGTADE